MRFVCESCRAQYMINDDKVGPKGVKVRCRKCGYVITVKRPEAAPRVPISETDEDAMATQVMKAPLGREEPPASGDSKAEQQETFLGADDDEIGAVFDQALRGGPTSTSAPRTGAEEGGGSPPADFDEHESTRVIDAAMVAQLAKESGTREPAPEAIEAAPETNWFVAINEKQTGPLTLEKVKEHWDQGEIGPDSLCWREGFHDWVPLSEVKSLVVVLAPKPPKPIVVPAATIPAVPSVVSVPVQSAFSAGGVVQSVQSEMQVPMPPVPVSTQEESGSWKPTAASALASLVKDEMDALAKPPPKASPPSAPDPTLDGRLIDVPEEKGAVPFSPLAGPTTRPAPNPYAENPAATYSAPGVTAYRPPSNRGLVIGLSSVVGIVLVGLIATVAWLVFGGRTPTSSQPPLTAQAPGVSQPSVATSTLPPAPGPTSPTTTTTKVPEVPAPSVPQPPPGAVTPPPATATPGTASSPLVAARAPSDTQATKEPRESKEPKEPKEKAPRKEPRAKGDTPPEPKEVKEVREEPRQPSGSDDFDSVFKVPGSRREEPKRAESTKRESYVPPAPGQGGEVKDSLGQSDIMEVVLSNKPSLTKCAEEQRQKEPGTTGKLVMRWSIQANGRVSNVVVVSEEFKSTHMAGCVGKAIKSWSFPRSKNPPDPFTLPVKF